MLGAIIGDLAAWTWENDYKNFYPKLVSQEVKLSDYAHTLFALMHDRDVPIGEYRRLLSFDGWEKERIKSVIRAIAVAWLYEDEEEMRHAIKSFACGTTKRKFMPHPLWPKSSTHYGMRQQRKRPGK